MLFGPNLRPERQKLRLIQLISQDTPSTPCEDGQRFCVLLRYEPEGSESQQLLQEQLLPLGAEIGAKQHIGSYFLIEMSGIVHIKSLVFTEWDD